MCERCFLNDTFVLHCHQYEVSASLPQSYISHTTLNIYSLTQSLSVCATIDDDEDDDPGGGHDDEVAAYMERNNNDDDVM